VTTAAEPVFNPFEPGFFDNPYRQYAQLRELAPVRRTPLGPWSLTRYADIARLLRNPTVSVNERHAEGFRPRDQFLTAAGEERRDRGTHTILNLDPPDHTRIRRLVGQAFTPRRIEALEPRIQALVDELLDAVAPSGRSDLIADLAFPLPFIVISELLGLPAADRDEMREVSHTLVQSLEPLIPPDELPGLVAASDRMTEYVEAAIEHTRRHPGDDLLSAMIAAEEDGERLSLAELRDQVVLLFVAGHETTVNLIGNGTLALLRHPDQLARLRREPGLIANGVDELLRYDAPVQFSRRIALEPIEIDDQRIEPGAFLFLVLGAANRDPAHFGPTADQLDLGRTDAAQHVSFGGGIHHCLGAMLARAEARAAIGTLVARFPDVALVDEPPAWNRRLVLRGLDRLLVTF